MSKKSNKTEQVLKLLTKEEEIINSTLEEENLQFTAQEDADKESALSVESDLKAATTPAPQKVEGEWIKKENHLVNLAEVFVGEKLHMVMTRLNVCSCATCENDVMAMALNSLPTQYITTDSGKQFLQLEGYKNQYETDVIAALTRACVRVKACPRHER